MAAVESDAAEMALVRELQEKVERLTRELGGRDRELKRADSAAKEMVRAKDKLIVQQSSQIVELKRQADSLTASCKSMEDSLARERERYASAEGRMQGGHDANLTLLQQAEKFRSAWEAVRAELESAREEHQGVCQELRQRVAAADERCIQLTHEVQQREAVIQHLKETLESARRIHAHRSQQQQQSSTSDLGSRDDRSNASDSPRDLAVNPSTQTPVLLAPSPVASFSGPKPETMHLEQLLRGKDQHIVRLSSDVIKWRSEAEKLQLRVSQLEETNHALNVTNGVLQSDLGTVKSIEAETASKLSRTAMQMSELHTERSAMQDTIDSLRREIAAALQKVAECRSQEDAHHSFRVQHVDCQSRIVEKDLAIFQLTNSLQECKRQLEAAQADRVVIQRQVIAANEAAQAVRERASTENARFEAITNALEVQLAEKKRCVHELEERLNEKEDICTQLQQDIVSVRAMRDEEREAWRLKTQRSDEVIHQLQSQVLSSAEQLRTREEQLQEQIAKLQSHNNHLLQSRKEQEAHVLHLADLLKREQQANATTRVAGMAAAAAAASHDENGSPCASPTVPLPPSVTSATRSSTSASTSLQKVSLELEELRLKHQRLLREYAAREQDVQNLLRRLTEAENVSGGDNSSTMSESRRLTGLLESLSVEVCQHLAVLLCSDFLRGGVVTTLPTVLHSFHLGKAEGEELIDALSRLMMLARCRASIQEMCRALHVKRESSIRRVALALNRVSSGALICDRLSIRNPSASYAASRRSHLLAGSVPQARFTFSGRERLLLLWGAQVQVDEDDEEDSESRRAPADNVDAKPVAARASTLARLGDIPYAVMLIASYLPVVIRGHTAFAAHTMTHEGNTAEPHGQTILLSLDPEADQFSLMECEVTKNRAAAVIISGTFKYAFSWQSCSHVRVQLTCKSKTDGFVDTASEGWKWSKPEKISSSSPSSQITYLIKHQRVSNSCLNASRGEGSGRCPLVEGLVAEAMGLQLRELSVGEVSMIQSLYCTDLALDDMMRHPSWESIPPPPPVGKSSASSRKR